MTAHKLFVSKFIRKNLKTLFLLIFINSSFFLQAQSSFSAFKKLSKSEKCWVLFHPLIAKKTLKITRQVIADVDSVGKTNVIGTDISGGKLDAFKHSYWMASLTVKTGKRKALKLGVAHERGNKKQFKKYQLEDRTLPDSVSCAMDLHNNNVGAGVVTKCEQVSKTEIQKRIMDALQSGKLMIIKKDKDGNILYCDGTFIDTNKWKGKWGIPKCFVASNEY